MLINYRKNLKKEIVQYRSICDYVHKQVTQKINIVLTKKDTILGGWGGEAKRRKSRRWLFKKTKFGLVKV